MICSFHLIDNFWQERANDTVIVDWRNPTHIFFRTSAAVFAWLLPSRKTVRVWLTAFQRVEVLSLGKLFLDLWFPAGLHFLIFSQVKSHWPVLSVVPACALVREDSDLIRSKHTSNCSQTHWDGCCQQQNLGPGALALAEPRERAHAQGCEEVQQERGCWPRSRWWRGCVPPANQKQQEGKRPWSRLVLSLGHLPVTLRGGWESWIHCAPQKGRSPGIKHKALAAAGPFMFYFRIFFDEYIKRV